MSNLGELTAVGEAAKAPLNKLGALVGTISDFAGAGAAIVGVVGLIINAWNGTKSDLDQIKAAIQAAFEKLAEQQKEHDTLERLTNLERYSKLYYTGQPCA